MDFESARNAGPSAYLPVEVRTVGGAGGREVGRCTRRTVSYEAQIKSVLSHSVHLQSLHPCPSHPAPSHHAPQALLTKLDAWCSPPHPIPSHPTRSHPPHSLQVLLAKLEALTGAEAAAQSLQQYQEMYRRGGGEEGEGQGEFWLAASLGWGQQQRCRLHA